jgi:branched-chain amino acid transport system substrate-binding protein
MNSALTGVVMARRFRYGPRLVIGAAVAVVGLGAATACSSSTAATISGSGGSGLPSTINIVSLRDETGPIATYGKNAENGTKVAVQEINSTKYLGNSKLVITYEDTTGVPQVAASLASQALANPSYVAMLGPIDSAQSVVVAPIVQRGKIPTVFTQSGSGGVVIGNYTFRATAPQSTTFAVTAGYLKSKDDTKVAALYATDNPTNVGLATQTLPSLAAQDGYTVVSTTGVASTDLDFSTEVSKIESSGADAVALFLDGPQFPPAVKLLRQSGFKGTIVSASAAGEGVLAPIGALGAGVVYTSDFNPLETDAGTQHFDALYEKMFGVVPTNISAEAYDATWMLARALKNQGKATRAAVETGLVNVAKAGFDGALGHDTFVGNDMRVAGVLTEWNGSKEILLSKS